MKLISRILDRLEENLRKGIEEKIKVRKKERRVLLIREFIGWFENIFRMCILFSLIISGLFFTEFIKGDEEISFWLILFWLFLAGGGLMALRSIQLRQDELTKKAIEIYGPSFNKKKK